MFRVALSTLVVLSVSVAAEVLIPSGSAWNYNDQGAQPTTWNAVDFDDSAWPSGVAEFGYGDGDEATEVGFGGDASSKFITTYFRKTVNINSVAAITGASINVLRDDGIVVYINGVEVARDNIPNGAVTADTLATSGVGGDGETTFFPFTVDHTAFVAGKNVIAAELHQNSAASSDASFELNMEVTLQDGASLDDPACKADNTCKDVFVSRGPFLQSISGSSVLVLVRTDEPTVIEAAIHVGEAGAFGVAIPSMTGSTPVTDHRLLLTGLSPDTFYTYKVVANSANDNLVGFTGSGEYGFTVAPTAGHAISTSRLFLFLAGNPTTDALDGYRTYKVSRKTDLVVGLGGLTADGSDDSYHSPWFGAIGDLLNQSPSYTVLDSFSAGTFAYAQTVFRVPSSGESGGLPSNTGDYYSANYGDIHFVFLNSEDVTDAQLAWLQADLANAASTSRSKWLIAVSNVAPYSKSGLDSDTDPRSAALRTSVLPILEAAGLDIFVSSSDGGGAYERSLPIAGHTGDSSTYSSGMVKLAGTSTYTKSAGLQPNSGSIYVVSDSSASVDTSASLDHPAMLSISGQRGIAASGLFAMELSGSSITGKFVGGPTGNILDAFTLSKGASSGTLPAGSSEPSATPSPSASGVPPSASSTASPIPASPSVTPTVSASFVEAPPSRSPSPSPRPAGAGEVDCAVVACSCITRQCCKEEDAGILRTCEDASGSSKSWQVAVAGSVVGVAVLGVLGYVFFKKPKDKKPAASDNNIGGRAPSRSGRRAGRGGRGASTNPPNAL